MPRISAGLLMYRIKEGAIEVLLAHPGGPFFSGKDEGAWSIPKGEPDADEDLSLTAQREFEEETGVTPTGPFIPLSPIRQKGGKILFGQNLVHEGRGILRVGEKVEVVAGS